MRHIAIIASACVLICGCSKPSADVQGVQQVFGAYKQSILSNHGSTSVKHIAQRTLDEYQQYVDWALRAERDTLERLSPISKMQVLLMRHLIPQNEWNNMSGEKAFIYAVDNDWIGAQQVTATTIRNIQISGATATAAVFIGNKKTPHRFHFIKENGSWKYDLTPTMHGSDRVLKSQIAQSGLTENDFMLRMIEGISGVKVTDAIWEPIRNR